MKEFSFAAMLCGLGAIASGCALIAGYDFGKYGERDGAGGDATSSSKSSTSDGPSSSTGAGGAGGDATVTVLYSGNDIPSILALDESAVYFTAKPAPLSSEGKVLRAASDGSSVLKLATMEKDPYSVCVDDTYVYWISGDSTQQVIKRAPKKGGGSMEIAIDPMTAVFAVSVQAQALYFTTPSSDTVWRKLKSGGSPTPVAMGQPSPSDIAADASAVYWLNRGSASAAEGVVIRAELDGSNQVTLATGQKFPLRIALGEAHVYWATLDGGLIGVGKDGKGLFPYVNPKLGNPPVTGIAADSMHLYYTVNNRLFKVPIESLSAEEIPLEGGYPTEIAVDDKSLYVAVVDNVGPSSVIKVPK